MKNRSAKILLAITLIFTLGTASFAAWFYAFLHTPRTHPHEDTYIEIPRGISTSEVLERLSGHGVIGREWPLRVYLRLSGDGPKIKAGEYRFPSPVTPLEVVSKLKEGEHRLTRLTVVEGWTRWEIAALLARVSQADIAAPDEYLPLLNDPALIRDMDPDAGNLEGYLFPDTYSFPAGTDPRTIIRAMIGRFREVWSELIRRNGAPPGRTPREIVTIASLIETEAKLPEERPLVASVIYNRLRLGIPLGIDSSVIYASKLAGKWRNDGKVYLSDLERVSPYNTRKVVGLPPGPIASPGASALEAALRPAQTDYLYYVREPARDDGAHNFYSGEAEFLRGVQALRDWERARNANVALPPAP